jgi:hypothetical protein
MRDCGNAEIRDVLPDLLDDAAGHGELAAARAHVMACASCQEELAFLRDVRRAFPAPRVDVGRIAAAIPPYRRASFWARASQSTAFRVAAGFVILVGVATATQVVSKDRTRPDTTVAMAPAAATTPSELAVGTMTDLSESDLESLVQDLGDLEAITPMEEDVVVLPALDRSGA